MPVWQRLRRSRSTELGGLAGDAFWVGLWQGAMSVAHLVQLALITHVLGLAELGRLALVMSFVVLVGQLFDVRVGVATTKFGAGKLAAGDIDGLSGVIQLSYLIDALTGALAFVLVAGLAPFVGPALVGDDGTSLILLFACTLLISTVEESSISVLRLMDRFRLLAGCGVALEAVHVGAIVAALAISPTLTSVLLALVVYYFVRAVTNLTVSNLSFSRAFGRSVRRPSLSAFDERRSMLRMVLHTNVVSYARITQLQLPTLVIGALSTTTQVGLFKVGTAAGGIVGRLADPAYAAVLPRLSRLWATSQRDALRHLIRRSTVGAAGVMGVALVAVIVLHDPILRLLGGDEGTAAATVLVLVAIAGAFSGTLFWNTGLLYAMGRAGVVAIIALGGALLQVGLLVPLVALYDANGAAIAFLVSTLATNIAATILAWRGLTEHRITEAPSEVRATEVPQPASRVEL